MVLEVKLDDPALELDRGAVDGGAQPATQIRSEEEPAEALEKRSAKKGECGLEEERTCGGLGPSGHQRAELAPIVRKEPRSPGVRMHESVEHAATRQRFEGDDLARGESIVLAQRELVFADEVVEAYRLPPPQEFHGHVEKQRDSPGSALRRNDEEIDVLVAGVVVGRRPRERDHAHERTPSDDVDGEPLALQQLSRAAARFLLKESFPLALGAVLTLVYLRADLFILAMLRDANETGLFQSAFRLFEATFVLSGGIAAGAFPILASRIGTPRFDVLSRFLLFLLASAGGVLACVFVLAGESIVTILFGQDFRLAAVPVAILGLGLLPVFANALTTHLLVASGRGRRLVLALGVRLAVGVSLDLVLVPRLGATGAAIAVTVAEWFLLAVSLTGVLDLLGFSQPPRTVSRARASSCS